MCKKKTIISGCNNAKYDLCAVSMKVVGFKSGSSSDILPLSWLNPFREYTPTSKTKTLSLVLPQSPRQLLICLLDC